MSRMCDPVDSMVNKTENNGAVHTGMIQINDDVSIPDEEFVFTASRSSGPGGQNVNKVSTRVTIRFDVGNSASLTDEQKRLILELLSTRANKNGVIRVSSQRYRSQFENRQAAVERLAELMRTALERKLARKRTRVPSSIRQRRIEEKKRRGQIKRERSRISED